MKEIASLIYDYAKTLDSPYAEHRNEAVNEIMKSIEYLQIRIHLFDALSKTLKISADAHTANMKPDAFPHNYFANPSRGILS